MTRKATSTLLLALGAIAALAAPATEGATPRAPSEPSCVQPGSGSAPPLFAESIEIELGHGVPERLAEAAVERWSRCAGYDTDFPRFVIGERGTQKVVIRFARLSSHDGRCGSFRGRRIDLYAFAVDGRGRRLHCGSRVDGLVHELGHALGLRDAPPGEHCSGHAMAHIDPAARDRREIQADECRAAGDRWLTRRELSRERQTQTETSVAESGDRRLSRPRPRAAAAASPSLPPGRRDRPPAVR